VDPSLARELACFATTLQFKLVLVPLLALLWVSLNLAWLLNQTLATVVVLIVKQHTYDILLRLLRHIASSVLVQLTIFT
jgi:hypothetical protein